MTFRRVLFWLHLAAGLIAGSVVLMMSVTGTLLTFQQSVLRRVERAQRSVDVPRAAARVPIETMIATVKAAFPDAEIASVTIESSPSSSVAIAIGARGTAFVDPYTGVVLGTGSAAARGFYRTLTNWHRYLAMSGEHRATGRAITGACNAAFLVLAISGLYLWMPRQWSWRHVRPVMWFRSGLRGKARDFNWHNAIGLWCAPVIVVLSATGLVLSYSWASNLVYTITRSPVPAQGARGGAEARGPRPGRPPAAGEGAKTGTGETRASMPAAPLDSLIARAAQQVPAWSTIALRVPARPGAAVSMSISDGAHWNRFARSTMTLDSTTGGVVRWEPYSGLSAGQKLRGWIRFAHTGELAGPVGEALAALACLGGAFLVYTGVALSLRRFAAWRARSGARPAAVVGVEAR